MADYNNDLFAASGQRLVSQTWNTDDANIRLTFGHRCGQVRAYLLSSLVTIYVHTAIDSQWALDTDPLQEVQSGTIKKQMISESINWNPLPRLYVQVDALCAQSNRHAGKQYRSHTEHESDRARFPQ